MRYHEFYEEKADVPRVKLDIDNKVYVVYNSDGTEFSRHEFEHVWNSSPAKRAAEQDLSQLKIEYRRKKKQADDAAAEAKPLSTIEQKYYDLSKSVERYNRFIYPRTPEDNILDKETRDLYIDTSLKWMKEMERLASGGTVRKSLIAGTFKLPA